MIRSYQLAPDDRADASLRKILGALFDTLLSNVEGVVSDKDIEPLHDLRVANRRTRTALSQLKDLLPSEVGQRYSPEFKWIGTVTGPCRDLDVTLAEFQSYLQDPALEEDRLTQLISFLEVTRRAEHHRVASALRSTRFQHLVAGWIDFLQSPLNVPSDPPLGAASIAGVSGRCILKANTRLRKRGVGISADAPPSLLHRLRIDGKKLRYLLEFFFDLYEATVVSRFIKELKRFQDILGDFNDTEVQLALVREFVDRDASRSAPAEVDELREIIRDRQGELRTEFAERFAVFASDESRKLYKRTFKAR
jgi:CHAD domain-containing protein